MLVDGLSECHKERKEKIRCHQKKMSMKKVKVLSI
jgi:hypothetical protein